MGKASRDKGKAGEREVVVELRAAMAFEHCKHDGDIVDLTHIRRGLQGQGDARGEVVPDVVAPGLWIEVKRKACMAPNVWRGGLEQATRAAEGTGLLPVCFYRGDREPWRVVLATENWCELGGGRFDVHGIEDVPVHVDAADFARAWAEWERGR